MPYSQSGWRESVDSQEEAKIGYIHEQFDNYCFLPRIENMKVAEYVVNINIVNRICTVKNKVRFIPTPQARNYSEDTRQESKFIYPIHNGASVCKFEAELYSKENTLVHRIKAKITEREQASQIFQQSKDEDKAAVMGTLDNTAADSFIIELGQIGPDQSVAVNFEYFMDLKVEEGGKHRHQSSDSRSRLMKLHLPMSHKKRFVVGERVPQHNLHENIYDSTFVTKVYLTCEPPAKRVFGKIMDSTGKIVERKISKHVHEELKLERWALNSEELKVCPVDIEIFIENSLGKDFSIGNMTDAFECNKKEAIYVTHIKPKKLIPDNFIPEFLKKEEKMKEYIFLIDRSGSMSGSLMKQAKHCLTQAIQQLPRKCKFNIVSFGSRFSKLWDVAQPYTSQNITEAKMHIDEMVANLGGTELLKPLEEIFNCYLDPKVEVRDIILLTDGSVSNTEEVLEFCARNKEKNRIFTVGIGSGASTCLVDGVAKNTRGQSIYVNLNDRMTQKVLQLARYTTEPVLVLIDVNFPSLPPQCIPSGPGIKGDEVYIYEETRLFFRIKKINEGFLKKYEGQNIRVEMTFKIGDQDAEYIHEFPINPVQSNENTSLMSYWAKQEIQKLEVLRRSIGFQGEHAEVKDRIVELSKEGNILHAYTAFIGICEKGNAPKAGSDPSASFHLTNSALETLHNYSGWTADESRPQGMPTMMSNAVSDIAAYSGREEELLEVEGTCLDSDSDDNTRSSSRNKTKHKSKTKMGWEKYEATIPKDQIHEHLIQLACPLTGTWKDEGAVWKLLKVYDMQLHPGIKATLCVQAQEAVDSSETMMTIIVLWSLRNFAYHYEAEWALMAKKSEEYLRKNSEIKALHKHIKTRLRQVINRDFSLFRDDEEE